MMGLLNLTEISTFFLSVVGQVIANIEKERKTPFPKSAATPA